MEDATMAFTMTRPESRVSNSVQIGVSILRSHKDLMDQLCKNATELERKEAIKAKRWVRVQGEIQKGEDGKPLPCFSTVRPSRLAHEMIVHCLAELLPDEFSSNGNGSEE